MMRLVSASMLAVSALASQAIAAPVSLRPLPGSPEMQVVTSIYGPWLAKHPEVEVQVGRVDLQGKGVASIVARFVSGGTCSAKRCETAVLLFDGKQWRSVFEKVASTLDTGPGVAGPTGDGMAAILIDGGERWEWTGLGRYMPDLRSIGTMFAAIGSLPAEVVQAARIGTAGAASGMSVQFRAARLDLGTGHSGWLATAYAPGLCSNTAGCPATILVQNGANWVPAWSGVANGNGAVLGMSQQGWRDVALALPQGYLTLRWTGTGYASSSTSFPSPLTPAP